jgi:hypothetical protein
MIANDSPQVFLFTVAPWTVFISRKLRGRVLVADFHVVDSGTDAGLIDRADLVVGKPGFVDETSVADGTIQNLEFGPISDPRGFVAHDG